MPEREPLLDADAPSTAILPASYSLKADDLDADELQAVDDELQKRGKELSKALEESDDEWRTFQRFRPWKETAQETQLAPQARIQNYPGSHSQPADGSW